VPDIFRIKILADLADPFWRTRQRTRQRKPAKPARRSSCHEISESRETNDLGVLQRDGAWWKVEKCWERSTSECRWEKKERRDPPQFWVFEGKLSFFFDKSCYFSYRSVCFCLFLVDSIYFSMYPFRNIDPYTYRHSPLDITSSLSQLLKIFSL
jgi:hypothetical protein